jgi:hypothetical protein
VSASQKAHSWVPLLPAGLLVAIAAGQIHLATRQDLTPWKGGGFGMFSSTDRGHNRRLRVWVSGPERSEEVAIPTDLIDMANNVLIFPSHRRLERLGREIALTARGEGGEIRDVRIVVWRREYDRATLESGLVPLREVRVEVTDLAP